MFFCSSSSFEAHRLPAHEEKHDSTAAVDGLSGHIDLVDAATNIRPLHGGSSEETTIMRILETLPKLVSLVRQFSKRYGQDLEDGSADLLPLLTGSLKMRLKSVTKEATDWLACV